MAQGLGIDIVAEGVENDKQASYLQSLGCHTMQGFLFSRPVRVDEFLERVAEQQRAIPSQSNA